MARNVLLSEDYLNISVHYTLEKAKKKNRANGNTGHFQWKHKIYINISKRIVFLLTEEAFASSVNICALFIQHYVTFLCTFTNNFLPAAKLSKIFPSSFIVVYINVNIGCKQYIKIVTLKTFYVHGFRRYCIVNILLFPNGYCISYIYF